MDANELSRSEPTRGTRDAVRYPIPPHRDALDPHPAAADLLGAKRSGH
ncbi:MAG: hypothetical protein K9L70_04305 [Thiohalocapsa sp.]|nr:hypothetical protein [Thiohalocapsa sp.]MCF7991830.1 hypothetical protein [Thiohalocapsa sp.]